MGCGTLDGLLSIVLLNPDFESKRLLTVDDLIRQTSACEVLRG